MIPNIRQEINVTDYMSFYIAHHGHSAALLHTERASGSPITGQGGVSLPCCVNKTILYNYLFDDDDGTVFWRRNGLAQCAPGILVLGVPDYSEEGFTLYAVLVLSLCVLYGSFLDIFII